MKKYILFVLFLIFSIPVYGQQDDNTLINPDEPVKLIVGVYDNYPLVFVDKQQNPEGIFPEIIEIIAKKHNWEIEYKHDLWENLLKMLETGEIDCVLSIAKTSERSTKYHFCNVSSVENFGVVYSNKNEEIFNLHRLENKRVGVLKDDVYYVGDMGIANLSKSLGLNCDFKTYDTYDQVLKATESGEVQAGVVNRIYGITNESAYNIRSTNILFNMTKIYCAFHKTDKNLALISIIDEDLRALMADEKSKLHVIHSKYLKKPKEKTSTWNLFLNIALILLVLIIVVMLFYYFRFKIRITRKAKLKIRESEERYRNLYETALVGLFRVNLAESTIIAANETCVKMFGYDSIDEFVAEFKTAEHYAQSSRRDEIVGILTSKQKIENEEIEVYKKDGSKIWVSLNERYFEKEGYSEGTILDITERKKIEQSIEEKANRLSILNKIISSANKHDDLETILREILESTLQLFNFDSGCIHFVDEISKTANLQCSHNVSEDITDRLTDFPIIDAKSKVIYLNGKTEFLDGVETALTKTIRNFGFKAGAIIPLMSKNKVIGTFIIAKKVDYKFSAEEKDLLNSVGFETGTIIQKIQIENELRKHKENLQTMFDSIEDFIMIFDENGRILDFNSAVSTRLGYEPEELMNMSILDIQHPSFRDKKRLHLNDMISSSKNIVNFPLFTRFDAEIPVETKISYGNWSGKNVYFAISRDISERIRAENDLRTSEQRNRALVESLPDLLFVIRKDGVCVDFKISNDTDLYMRREDVIGVNILATMPKDVSVKAKEYLKRAFETKTVQVFEYMLEMSTGINHYEARFSVSSPSEAICVVRNISDRKKMEEALSSEKERLSLTLKSIGDGVITTDINGRIVLVNDAFERITGYSQAEAYQKKLPEIFKIFNEKTQAIHPDPFTSIMSSENKVIEPSNVALETKDGDEISISFNAVPIRDKDRMIHGIVIVFRDERLSKKLETEILRASKLESVGILAGGIAHDFNNFVTVILGNSTLGMIYAKDDDNLYELFDEIKKASTRAKDLTYQLLTFSRGGAPILKTTSISDIIKETASFALRGSNVLCKFAIYGELWNVEIDVGQINQVFNNIIINADQAMPEGGILEIAAENYYNDPAITPALTGEKYVKITVQDEGIGILEENLPRIFDPYFTTKETGSGLGLATAYSIIQKHDGLIDVESDNYGTTFFIYLPASSKKIDTGVVKTDDPIMGEGTVLVMDDEEIIRSLAENLLKHLGYNVIQAKDGEEAIKIYSEALANNEKIDLLIMDLTVPGGMGGKDAMEKILEVDPDAKAVVSSGYYSDPVLSEHKKYGFKAVLTKPYEIGELSEIVNNVIKEIDESD